MESLRLLSYNIRAGLGTDGIRDLERVATVIRQFNPDLLVVQEVDRHVPRSRCADQFHHLTQALGLNGHFAKTIDLHGGDYGIALFSRWPFCQHFTCPLPAQEGHEDRVLAGIEVRPPGSNLPLWWLGTHLARYSAELRLAQAEAIDAFVASHLPPEANVILAGDFNDSRHSPPLRHLSRHWTLVSREAPTYPANAPEHDIDHILFRHGSRLECLSAGLISEQVASDHLPTYVLAVETAASPASPEADGTSVRVL